MDSVGGLGMQCSLFYDAGLGFSTQSNSTSSISSGSPPMSNLLHSLSAGNAVDVVSRPSWVFDSQMQPVQDGQTCSPTDSGFSASLFAPFALSPLDRKLNIGQLAGAPHRQTNDRTAATGKQYGMMSLGQQLASNPIANGNGYAPPPKNPKLYKTELCRSWMEHNRCNYGERCQYAHSEQEKRPVPQHPKYKTEACQSFHRNGYCSYGPKCNFIHNCCESDMRNLLLSQPSMFPSATMRADSSSGPGGPTMIWAPLPGSAPQRMTSLSNYGNAGESFSSSRSSDGSGSHSQDYSAYNGFHITSRKSYGFRLPARVDEDNELLSGMLSNLMMKEENLGWEERRTLSEGSRLPVFTQLSGQ